MALYNKSLPFVNDRADEAAHRNYAAWNLNVYRIRDQHSGPGVIMGIYTRGACMRYSHQRIHILLRARWLGG
jgi:hypothetical protein